jgi:hypothetical protein
MDTNHRGKLFQVAILYHPKATKDQNERGEVPKSVIVKAPEHVLATTDREAGIRAAKGLPDDYLDKLEDVEILVRPF